MPLALTSILINDHKGTCEPLMNLRSTFAQVLYPEKVSKEDIVVLVRLGEGVSFGFIWLPPGDPGLGGGVGTHFGVDLERVKYPRK